MCSHILLAFTSVLLDKLAVDTKVGLLYPLLVGENI